jgi:excisionase family DNA binding protein
LLRSRPSAVIGVPTNDREANMLKPAADDEIGPMHFEPIAVGISEACRLTGLGRSKLYELLTASEIPSVKIGKRRVIPVAALRDFIDRLIAEQQRSS